MNNGNNGVGYPQQMSTRGGHVGYAMPGVVAQPQQAPNMNGHGLGQASETLANRAQQVFSAAQELRQMATPTPSAPPQQPQQGGMTALAVKWGIPAALGLGLGYLLWRK